MLVPTYMYLNIGIGTFRFLDRKSYEVTSDHLFDNFADNLCVCDPISVEPMLLWYVSLFRLVKHTKFC